MLLQIGSFPENLNQCVDDGWSTWAPFSGWSINVYRITQDELMKHLNHSFQNGETLWHRLNRYREIATEHDQKWTRLCDLLPTGISWWRHFRSKYKYCRAIHYGKFWRFLVIGNCLKIYTSTGEFWWVLGINNLPNQHPLNVPRQTTTIPQPHSNLELTLVVPNHLTQTHIDDREEIASRLRWRCKYCAFCSEVRQSKQKSSRLVTVIASGSRRGSGGNKIESEETTPSRVHIPNLWVFSAALYHGMLIGNQVNRFLIRHFLGFWTVFKGLFRSREIKQTYATRKRSMFAYSFAQLKLTEIFDSNSNDLQFTRL